jgi:hypothetical protein
MFIQYLYILYELLKNVGASLNMYEALGRCPTWSVVRVVIVYENLLYKLFVSLFKKNYLSCAQGRN